MAKTFIWRVIVFGFSEMAKDTAKFEAKYLSTVSQGFIGSQHKLQSQNPLTEQHSGSQHNPESQRSVTQQHRERMGLQNKKTLATKQTTKNQSQGSPSESLVKSFSEPGGFSKKSKPSKRRERKETRRNLEGHSDKPNSEGQNWVKKQSHESQSESQVKMGSESGGFSVLSSGTEGLALKEATRRLESLYYKPNSEGQENKQWMKTQSQESQSESQVRMGSESVGFSELSNCTEGLAWEEAMRRLESLYYKPISEGQENKQWMKTQSQESQSESQVRMGSESGGFSELSNFTGGLAWKEDTKRLESLYYKPNSEGQENKQWMKTESQESQSESQVRMGSESGGFSELSNFTEGLAWKEDTRRLEKPNSEGQENKQWMKKQSQESQSESQVTMGSESGGFSELSNCTEGFAWKDATRRLESLYYKPNSEGQENRQWMKTQLQESQSESQVTMGSESGGFFELSNCTEGFTWKEATRILESHYYKPNSEGQENKQWMKTQSQESQSESLFRMGSESGGFSELSNFTEGLAWKQDTRRLESLYSKPNSEGQENKQWMKTQSQESQSESQVRMSSESGGFSELSNFTEGLAWKEDTRRLESLYCKPNSEGQENKEWMKKQSQESQSESQVRMCSESGGFSELSNCTEGLAWKEATRRLESLYYKPDSEGQENKQWMKKLSQESQNDSQVKMGSESEAGADGLAWKEATRRLESLDCKSYIKGHITLSDEQKTVLDAVSRGQSVFITGSAGTGKSYLLNFVGEILKEMHGEDSVFVTASTGIAACHLNGMTLHSFAGAPPHNTTKEELLVMVENKHNDKSVNRWLNAKALIIDEISMIDGEFFDQLNYVANVLRWPLNRKPVWGGLQLVVTGDFFQLPPVMPQNPDKFFAFQADCWNECFDKQIELTNVFRQSDRELLEMLQEIRRGRWDEQKLVKLKNCHGPFVTRDESVTRLYPRKKDVRKVNDERLKALEQEIIPFTAKDTGGEHEKIKLKSGIAPDQIGLCIGAQVMLIKTIETDIGLVNGATGEIVEFVENDTYSGAIGPTELWPKVRFLCGVERIITPETWYIYDGEVEVASRTQVPLILAWAVTVHKSQGMTLERLETDLSEAFGYGMVYVALSRVKTLDGLRLIGFEPRKIKAHPAVLEFYKKLTGSLDDEEKN